MSKKDFIKGVITNILIAVITSIFDEVIIFLGVDENGNENT